MKNDNRKRTSIPILGIDTSTDDLLAKDGAQQELHNLRFAGGSWRNVRPFAVQHELHATQENTDFFASASIIYHHPAAADDVYIVSIPDSSGTQSLCQASVKDGSLTVIPKSAAIPLNLNPLVINSVYDMTLNKWRTIIGSMKPVASDLEITAQFEAEDGNSETHVFKIASGESSSDTFFNAAAPSNPTVTPNADDTYTYRLYFSIYEAQKDLDPAFVSGLPESARITHFGNILIIINPKEKRVVHYYLNSGYYEAFSAPAPPVIRQSMDFSTLPNNFQRKKTRIKFFEQDNISGGELNFFNQTTGLFYFPQIEGDFFWGEICLFAAFQMADGSLIAPSALNIVASEAFYVDKTTLPGGPAYENSTSGTDYMSLPSIDTKKSNNEVICTISYKSACAFMILPFLTITLPEGINTDLIKFVNLYATRINPIWSPEKLKTIPVNDSGGATADYDLAAFFSDNKLPEQPFYLVKSLPISDFKDHILEMYLTAELLKDLEQKTTYDPINAHTLFYDISKEYNSRWHISGTMGTYLFRGYGNDFYIPTTAQNDYVIATELRIENNNYYPSVPVAFNPQNTFVANKILSYPDYRASSMYGIGAGTKVLFKLLQAISSNYSYAVNGNDRTTYGRGEVAYVKYSARPDGIGSAQEIPVYTNIDFVLERGKIRVSAPNNPFFFPLANTYAVGGENNMIRAVNSAAIEMSDTKFGEFPLYVFSDEGIFALQSGSGEVLYSAVIPINYDRIINPRTLAVNYNILYITSRGVHAMYSNRATLISTPINDISNLPPLDFLAGANICYQHMFGEIILCNESKDSFGNRLFPHAFVFSLEHKTWSTRDFSGAKINTDEIVQRIDSSAIRIYDLSEEAEAAQHPVESTFVRLLSRPVKLGDMEFKRLETFIPRIWAGTPLPMRFTLEGSVDLKRWALLRDTGTVTVQRDITVRRTPRSFRYLRLAMEAAVAHDIEISGFDIEYYMRFLHRLR